MSFSIIPGVFLIILVILSGVDDPVSKQEKKSFINKQLFSSKKPIGMLDQKESDQKTIYNYITSKFKKVSIDDAKNIAEDLVNYGKKHNVDPKFAAAVIARESGFKKDAVSVTGAKGLGQIKDFNYKDLKINDPFNINQNVNGTIKYLKKMIKKWNENNDQVVVEKGGHQQGSKKKLVDKKDHLKLALASYYKGFTAVKQTGVDQKTQKYIEDILDYYQEISNSEER
ncbi:hypothetical protein CL658_03750 [bacterium]|nr:hypothetical protein [bacterium]|tara:strand:+ start:2036 stop:2716 length:681 start_codon:yes stop_codon:yes gene_type:complete